MTRDESAVQTQLRNSLREIFPKVAFPFILGLTNFSFSLGIFLQ